MKNTALIVPLAMIPLLLGSAGQLHAQTPSAAKAPPTTASGADPAPAATPEQISYMFGLLFGTQLHSSGVSTELSPDTIARGIKDALAGKSISNSDQQQIHAYMQTIIEASAAKNLAAANEFLARNGKVKGVVTTPSGLQYKVISPGDAKAQAITAADTVSVDYRGKLLDGSEFDSSFARGVPATFPVSGVIKGWQEALVMMKPGAKWQLFVPPELAYGPNARPKIPGNSLLIFEVNVLRVDAKNGAPAAPPGTPTSH